MSFSHLSPLATPCQACSRQWGDGGSNTPPLSDLVVQGDSGCKPPTMAAHREGAVMELALVSLQRSLGRAYQGRLLEEAVSELGCVGRVELSR